MIWRHSSTGNSAIGCDAAMPAALTNTSSAPKRSTVSATAAAHDAGVGDVARRSMRALGNLAAVSPAASASRSSAHDARAFGREPLRDRAPDAAAAPEINAVLPDESLHRSRRYSAPRMHRTLTR